MYILYVCVFSEDTANYWTYHGSLTTPPCCESVQWVVFETPIKFSHQQLDVLRSLKHCGDDKCIMDNYRPPLPVGNRKVRTTHPITSSWKLNGFYWNIFKTYILASTRESGTYRVNEHWSWDKPCLINIIVIAIAFHKHARAVASLPLV